MDGLGSERVWLKGLFSRYYAQHPVSPPYDVSRREFGHGTFKKIDARHVSFDDASELNAFLANAAPLYVSASVSQFLNPSVQPMTAKGLVGSDLIYEFDADDIPTPCKLVHDSWRCPHCGASGKGHVMKCTSCAHGTELDEWVCPECLRATKEQTLRLLGILQDDFGFSEKDLSVNFSGSKGYHTHVRSTSIFTLPKSARVELMDYLSLFEIDLPSLGFSFDGKQYRCPRFTESTGHASRLLQGILRLIETGSSDEWAILSGSSPRTLQSFLADRPRLYSEVQSGILPPLPGKKTESFWNATLSSLVDSLKLTIDRQTSGDIYRLIRVPDTLHGSTGFRSESIPLARVSEHDPFLSATAFSTLPPRTLFVRSCPLLSIGGEVLDPISEREVTVSGPMAVYLVAWGAATLR
ncbi:MAG: DNA primase small subunit domain-containing protein [archaeon]